jgi:hypothetical protein
MKKIRTRKSDELREEYDFSKLGRAVRGKYYKRASSGPLAVVIHPASKKKATRRKR